MNQPYNYYPQYLQRSNVLPPQQIPQANGKTSIDMLQMSPNSSVLIADTTAPIVWRCVSDSLGNVTAEPFDITPHKDETQVEQENILVTLSQMNTRLTNLEEKINESTITRNADADAEFISTKTANASSSRRKKSASILESDDE